MKKQKSKKRPVKKKSKSQSVGFTKSSKDLEKEAGLRTEFGTKKIPPKGA